MKQLLFYTLLASSLLFSACEDETPVLGETATVNLNFSAKFDGNDLDSDNLIYHNYEGNSKIRFQTLSFLISDVVLYSNADADETELFEVEYIDLSRSNTDSKVAASIPTGNYNGIKFNLGLSPIINSTDPSPLSDTHPLNKAGYWTAWSSYIYCKLEGKLDIVGEGNIADEMSFSYHTGTIELMRPMNFIESMALEADTPQEINFEIDVNKLLTRDGEFFDVETFNATHSPGDEDQLNTAIYIMDNFENAMTIE